MIEETNNEQVFITEDMTLVAFLKVKGYEPSLIEKTGPRNCRWRFSAIPQMMDEVSSYGNYEALVDPRDFNRKLGLVRKAMLEALGANNSRSTHTRR